MALTAAGAYALGSGIAAAAGTANTIISGVNASNLNSKNRSWQEKIMQQQRDWSLEDWERENDVSAWYNRVSNAGLNPPLIAGQANLSQPSSSVHSPNGALPNPYQHSMQFDASSFNNAANMLLQGQQVEAQSKVANAQSVSTILQAAIEGFKIGGKDLYNSIIDKFAPYLSGSSPEDGLIVKTAKEQLRSYQLENDQKALTVALSRKYSEKQILTGIESIEQSISESVGRLNSMRVVNEKTYQEVANSIVMTAAQAFNLRAQGSKSLADAATINAIRKYVVSSAKSEADIKSDESYYSGVYREGFENAAGYITSEKGKKNLGEAISREGSYNSSALQYFLDREFKMLLGTAGAAIKVVK